MNVSATAHSLGKLLASRRPGGYYLPGVAVVTSVVTVATLLSVMPGSTVTTWTLTGDASPIAEAGGVAQPVVGYLQFSLVRIYVPLLSVLLVAGGELIAAFLGRFRIATAVFAGVGAGVQPIVVAGCGCGYGTAGSATTLIEYALGAGLL